jgi:hypothetical protein
MKTKPVARGILKIRAIVLCLAIVGVAGVEFWACESLTTRLGQATAFQSEGSQVPHLGLNDLMAAAPVVR